MKLLNTFVAALGALQSVAAFGGPQQQNECAPAPKRSLYFKTKMPMPNPKFHEDDQGDEDYLDPPAGNPVLTISSRESPELYNNVVDAMAHLSGLTHEQVLYKITAFMAAGMGDNGSGVPIDQVTLALEDTADNKDRPAALNTEMAAVVMPHWTTYNSPYDTTMENFVDSAGVLSENTHVGAVLHAADFFPAYRYAGIIAFWDEQGVPVEALWMWHGAPQYEFNFESYDGSTLHADWADFYIRDAEGAPVSYNHVETMWYHDTRPDSWIDGPAQY